LGKELPFETVILIDERDLKDAWVSNALYACLYGRFYVFGTTWIPYG